MKNGRDHPVFESKTKSGIKNGRNHLVFKLAESKMDKIVQYLNQKPKVK